MAGAAADVEHRRWRRRQMREQLLVQHIGAHEPFHGGIGFIGKLVSQPGPDVIAHNTKIWRRACKALTVAVDQLRGEWSSCVRSRSDSKRSVAAVGSSGWAR